MSSTAPQPLINHLLELRWRLIISSAVFSVLFCLCYAISDKIFSFLVAPLAKILTHHGHDRRLIYTGLTEAFLTYVKVAVFSASLLSFPLIATQIWLFIAPGLYQHERRLFLPILLATPLLFILGAAFAYYVVFPAAYTFFLSFETVGIDGALPIQLEAKVNEYLAFVMRLIFAFGLSFELPVLLTVLASVGIVSVKGLIEKWRFSVVGIFTVAAFITPPDVFSMLALAFPLILLYGLSIFMVGFVERRKMKRDSTPCSI